MSHYHIVSTAVEFMWGREYLHHLLQVLPATPILTGTMSSHGRAYNALGHGKPAVHAISADLLVIRPSTVLPAAHTASHAIGSGPSRTK